MLLVRQAVSGIGRTPGRSYPEAARVVLRAGAKWAVIGLPSFGSTSGKQNIWLLWLSWPLGSMF